MHYANIRENFCEPEKEKKLDFQSVGVFVYTYRENNVFLQMCRNKKKGECVRRKVP